MTTLIGIDVGTSGTRALAVTTEGRLVAEATRPHTLQTPRPGWTEQDPAEWWEACKGALAEVAAAVGDDEVAGLGLAGQMHGSVFLDASGEVIRPALLWNDQRTARAMRRDHRSGRRVAAARARRQSGADGLPGAEDPLAARRRSRRRTRAWPACCCRRTTSASALTGDRATDASDASGTLLLDVRRARLVGGDPRRAGDPARVAARGVRGPGGDRHAARRAGRRARPPARAAGRRGRRRQRGGGRRRRRSSRRARCRPRSAPAA